VKVLVTGAAGMLGTDVVRAAQEVNHQVVALAHADLDVTDARAVARCLSEERPDAVVNCAGYTDVDGAEDDLPGAMDVNADGAGNVARGAAEVDAKVLYVSTDYVFDGSKSEPYVESDEPRPVSVYGQSKLAGEHETRAASSRHFVARSSWLFGVAGKNFVETMLTLARDHGEVLVVRDQVGCPTYTAHLADALVRLIDTDVYGLYHLAGGGECSWFDFAREIFRQARIDCRVMSCTTQELGRPAPRPPYSALATERSDAIHLPDWTEGLASYLADRAVKA
jgi:dTDP-4-dehydrorhamnose reductase